MNEALELTVLSAVVAAMNKKPGGGYVENSDNFQLEISSDEMYQILSRATTLIEYLRPKSGAAT